MRGIGHIDQFRFRQLLANMLQHRETAYAGIKYTDGDFHGLNLAF
jgi:hypothetical protein